MTDFYVHPTALIEEKVTIGAKSKIWHFCHVRSGASIGENCSIGRDCYIDSAVKMGNGTRIQNGVSIYNGVQISESVFIGPHVVFTNDMFPRAGAKKWKVDSTYLDTGCSLGAGAIVRCGIRLGAFSMIGAGALVTKDIPAFTLVTGFPARPVKKICACGRGQFVLDDPNWTSVLPCCEEYLTDHVIALAREYSDIVNAK